MSKKTVKLSSESKSVAVNGYTKLTFNFDSIPVGFTLDDLKVVNGVVTNLTQTSDPLVWTALFTPGNTKHPVSTIKLDGDYTTSSGKGNPSNTLVLKNDGVVLTPTVGFSNNNYSVVEGNDNIKSFTYTVSLSTAVSSTVTVDYTTNQLKGTATAGSDFVAKTGSVTFAPGETSKTFTVDVIGDTVHEGKEYFYVHLTSATGATLVADGAEGYRSSWNMTNIIDDDVNTMSSMGFSSNNFSIVEGNDGMKKFDFVVSLDKVSSDTVTVGYTTNKLKGTATEGSDFIRQEGVLTFAPGELSKTISIDVVGDTTYESNEYFYLHLTSVAGGTLVVKGAEGYRSDWVMGNIVNDDVNPIPTVGFATNNASIVEGDFGTKKFEFIASLNKVSSDAVTVGYTTNQLKGTATEGSDFVAQTGTLTFAPGELSKTISIDVIGDTTYEGKEYFYLHLTSADGAELVLNKSEGYRSSWTMGNITNDDLPGSVGPASIYGTSGKDTLGGTSAADVIDGMGGHDVMTGYAGSDLFILSAAYGAEVLELTALITDFKVGEDRIGLKDGLKFEDLVFKQGTGSYANDAVIYTDTGESLVLLAGVKATELGVADFWAI
jgi:hypothetical protein